MKTTIIVSYDAGWGNSLSLRGGVPLSWESGRTMSSVDHCTWQLELELESPLEFKPLLNDTVWAFGHRDYRVEPGQTARVFPHFRETPGWADTIGYIPFKGRDVTVRLYTPPGYRENAGRRYPVLYCLDGESLFEGHANWELDETLNTLIQARAVEPLLVVGVDCVDKGSTLSRSKAEEFGPFVLKLKETVDRTYPTLPEACHTGILGAGTGGLCALAISRLHAHIFGRIGALSPNWWAGQDTLDQVPLTQAHAEQRIYLDCESKAQSDVLYRLAETLASESWTEGENLAVEVLEQTPHRGDAWPGRIGAPLRFLFPWSGR